MFASNVRLLMSGACPSLANGADSLDFSRFESRLRDSEAIDWPQIMQLNADMEAMKARIKARLMDDTGPALGDSHGHFNWLFDTVLAMLRDTAPRLH